MSWENRTYKERDDALGARKCKLSGLAAEAPKLAHSCLQSISSLRWDQGREELEKPFCTSNS